MIIIDSLKYNSCDWNEKGGYEAKKAKRLSIIGYELTDINHELEEHCKYIERIREIERSINRSP